MSTQVKFAPFGIGIHSMDSEEAKKMYHNAKAKGKDTCFFLVGCGVILGELALRKSANALNIASETIADVHAGYLSKVKDTAVLYHAVNVVRAL